MQHCPGTCLGRAHDPLCRCLQDAYKQVPALLDSQDAQAILDRETGRLRGRDTITGRELSCSHSSAGQRLPCADALRVADCCWPSLCQSLLSFARNTAKQQVDAGVARTLRKLVQVAEDGRPGSPLTCTCGARQPCGAAAHAPIRAGRECALPLLRVVGKLFAYIGDTLEMGSVPDAVRAELGLMLRQHLLPVAEYCQEVPAATFESARPAESAGAALWAPFRPLRLSTSAQTSSPSTCCRSARAGWTFRRAPSVRPTRCSSSCSTTPPTWRTAYGGTCSSASASCWPSCTSCGAACSQGSQAGPVPDR